MNQQNDIIEKLMDAVETQRIAIHDISELLREWQSGMQQTLERHEEILNRFKVEE